MDEAVALATGFQTSLQDTMNWLTQAEQTLNMAQPPSLILDTVLFQIDEHKVPNALFTNELELNQKRFSHQSAHLLSRLRLSRCL